MPSLTTRVNSAVESLLQHQASEGRQIGGQVSAYHHGVPVVEAQAGQLGPEDSRPVQADSLFLSFSATKGIAATAVHMLADRGQLEYDAPVTRYWPAFGKNGKENITVAQALSHQAGLHAMPSPFKPEHITDWEAGLRRIEEATPAWEPGTANGYHAVTFGWIVGGIVAGASGQHIKDYIATEIAGPLGVGDEMYVGIPRGVEPRLATIEIHAPGEGMNIPEESDFYKAMPRDQWEHFNTMPFREACLPSGNGHFSARAIARMYAALAGDGSIDGVRLVSPGRLPHMQRVMTDDLDRVLRVKNKKGIGFTFGGETNGVHGPMGPRETAFGHGGAGGSTAFADPEVGLAVAVTINKMAFAAPGKGVADEICDLIRTELGIT